MDDKNVNPQPIVTYIHYINSFFLLLINLCTVSSVRHILSKKIIKVIVSCTDKLLPFFSNIFEYKGF